MKLGPFATPAIFRHTAAMAATTVKSLHRTGRLSRKKVRAVVAKVRAELDKQPAPRKIGKLRASDTASGSGAITFRFAKSRDAMPKAVASPIGTARKRR